MITPDLRAQLIALFKTIEQERMQDVPILNDALSVDAFGFEEPWADFDIGVLLTPWFMNLLLVPQNENLLATARVGEKQVHVLPAGPFEFVVAHEEAIGTYLSCPLFSPMFQFADQVAAVETAQAVLVATLEPADTSEPDPDQGMKDIWDGKLPEPEEAVATECDQEVETTAEDNPERTIPEKPSRRDLLTGFRSRSTPTEQEPVS